MAWLGQGGPDRIARVGYEIDQDIRSRIERSPLRIQLQTGLAWQGRAPSVRCRQGAEFVAPRSLVAEIRLAARFAPVQGGTRPFYPTLPRTRPSEPSPLRRG